MTTARKKRFAALILAAIPLGFLMFGLGVFLWQLATGAVEVNTIGGAIVIFVLFLGATTVQYARTRKAGRHEPYWKHLAFVGILATVATSLHSAMENSRLLWAWIPTRSVIVVGLPLIVAAACALFWVRLKARTLYGASEFLVALAFAWRTLPTGRVVDLDASTLPVAALLTGCVYLMVRGLDNVQQGWATDAVIGWLRQRKGRK